MKNETGQVATVDNPFERGRQVSAASIAEEAESARAIAEVQAALTIGKKFPRDTLQAMDRIINACARPGLAKDALYSFARGGNEITGPSIRLAEAIAQEWGNMQFGIRELSNAGGSSFVEAYAWDVERNVSRRITFHVPHERHTSRGKKQLTDPRDIYESMANVASRRLRACILAVIPGDVVESAVRQVGITQEASVDITPDSLQRMLKAFEDKFGVTQQHIETRIQRRIEAILPAQKLLLDKVYISLRDGIGKPSDWFDIEESEQDAQARQARSSDLNSKIAPKAADGAPKPEQEAKPETEERPPQEKPAEKRPARPAPGEESAPPDEQGSNGTGQGDELPW